MAHDNCIDTLNDASLSASVTMSPTWRGWLSDGKSLFVTAFKRAFAQVAIWHRRTRQRQHLAELDPRLLVDAGIAPDAAQREAQKPFWQD